MANVQVGVWNLILNLNLSTISSSHCDVFSMVEASGGTSQGSSLSILEVNLDSVVSHTFEHLTGQFEETERFDISLVSIVEKLKGICFTWSTLSLVSIHWTLLPWLCYSTILASDFVDFVSVEQEIIGFLLHNVIITFTTNSQNDVIHLSSLVQKSVKGTDTNH